MLFRSVDDFGIYQSNSAGGDPFSAGTARLYFNGNGNVGIGTTSPTAKLHVNGTFIASGTTGDVAYISSDFSTAATVGRVLHLRDGKAAVGTDSYISVGWTSSPGQDVYIGKRTTSSAGYLAIQNSSATELFTIILSNGNVGIGTTSPSHKLAVYDSGRASTTALNAGNSNTIPAISIQSGADTWANATNGFAYYYNSTNGNLDLYRKEGEIGRAHV